MIKPMHLLWFLIGFIFYAFIPNHGRQYVNMKEGDTLIFKRPYTHHSGKNHRYRVNGSASKASYDSSSYNLVYDEVENYSLSNVKNALGETQDEMDIFGFKGMAVYKENSLFITLENIDSLRVFWVNLNEGIWCEWTSKPTSITLQSRDLNQNIASFYSRNPPTSLGVMAVPFRVKSDQLFVASHPAQTLAHFNQIQVNFEDGQILQYLPGKYMLCQGRTFSLKK